MNILIIAALIVFALPIGVVVCLIIQNSDTNYQNEKQYNLLVSKKNNILNKKDDIFINKSTNKKDININENNNIILEKQVKQTLNKNIREEE